MEKLNFVLLKLIKTSRYLVVGEVLHLVGDGDVTGQLELHLLAVHGQLPEGVAAHSLDRVHWEKELNHQGRRESWFWSSSR